MNMLRRLTPRRTPLRLADVNDFAKFFAWLNASLRTVSVSQPGERIQTPGPHENQTQEGGQRQANRTRESDRLGGDLTRPDLIKSDLTAETSDAGL